LKRTLIALGVATAMLGSSATIAVDAEAARKAYWTEAKGEKRLKQQYSDIVNVWCVGASAYYRVIRGREYWTAFTCSTSWSDSSELELYPTGKRSFYDYRLW
jgi:hypothetical protein